MKLKSLLFYSVAIGSAIILFKTVTAYGESALKAPPPISGRYLLQTQNLPECLKAENLVLNIQQSGIYLFGSLAPREKSSESTTEAEEKPSLSGLLRHRQLVLSGTIPHLSGCDRSLHKSAEIKIIAELEPGAIAPQPQKLTGKITFNFISDSTEFTAELKPKIASQKSAH
jgi:hypothetical protein